MVTPEALASVMLLAVTLLVTATVSPEAENAFSAVVVPITPLSVTAALPEVRVKLSAPAAEPCTAPMVIAPSTPAAASVVIEEVPAPASTIFPVGAKVTAPASPLVSPVVLMTELVKVMSLVVVTLNATFALPAPSPKVSEPRLAEAAVITKWSKPDMVVADVFTAPVPASSCSPLFQFAPALTVPPPSMVTFPPPALASSFVVA